MKNCNRPLYGFLAGLIFITVSSLASLHSQCAHPLPTFSGVTSLSCGQQATLTASGAGTSFRWYKQSAGGSPVHIGATYVSDALQSNDTIYLETGNYSTINQTFNYTGGMQTLTVPPGVFEIRYDVRGAQGGNSITSPAYGLGGFGARVTGVLSVTPGQTLNVYVGQQSINSNGGWNGGGSVNNTNAITRGGGGASDIRIGGTALSNRVVVAGGGGGAARNSTTSGQHGGDGGAQDGDAGRAANTIDFSWVGRGGTQAAGGLATSPATAGSLGVGGNGIYATTSRTGGGGGGGYFGGGGGNDRGGGGGGSNYADMLSSNVLFERGFQEGNGQVLLSWDAPSCLSPRLPIALDVTNNAVTPVVSGTTSIICGQNTVLTASSGGQSIRWFDAPVGGNLVGTDSVYTTSLLTSRDTFYVARVSVNSGSRTFSFTGRTQQFVVPSGVTRITVDAQGAKGGNANGASWALGGNGGRIQAQIPVTPGQVLYVNVGGMGDNGSVSNIWIRGGWNGGGHGYKYGGGGGGATDIRTVAENLNSRIIVAGGGGGGGYRTSTNTTNDRGGRGGNTTAENGFYSGGNTNTSWIGTAGSQVAGGTRGFSGDGFDGSLGQGGRGTSNVFGTTYGSGGGGGGWFGGGGSYYSGGGGGSSYALPGATNISHTLGANSGHGTVTISWSADVCQSPVLAVPVHVNDTVPLPQVSGTTVFCGTSPALTASGSFGHYRWYNQPIGGNLLSTDTTFNAPNLFSQITYYVEATSVPNAPYCVSPRVAVVANTIPVPEPTVQGDSAICGGSVSLSASGSTNLFKWYTQPSGGTPFSTSATPVVTPLNTTTYYVEATSSNALPGSQTFNFTGGTQAFTVPAGVTSISVDVYGAQGGSNNHSPGGLGGRVRADIAVTPGEQLFINVGGTTTTNNGGWNGGGLSGTTAPNTTNARGGGGASDIRTAGNGLSDRLVVAGGGGGSGANCNGTNNERGGSGGGPANALDGASCNTVGNAESGRGGTQTAGGINATNCTTSALHSGSFGQGGQGNCSNQSNGGGGGGGWWGGGGGRNGGAGGGSSYVNPTRGTNVIHNQGVRSGNGQVIISWTVQTCESQRLPVVATINNLPNPQAADDTVTCASTAVLTASGSIGSYHWFAQPSGGTPFAQGAVVATAPIFQPTIFYLEAFNPNNTCVSDRVPVTVLIDSLPAPSVTGHDTLCDSGSTLFIASGGTGTYQWFNVPNGNMLQTGATFATGIQTDTLIRFVRYQSGSCFSPYTQARLLITPTPDASISAASAFCSSDPVQTFTALSQGGTWAGTGIVNASMGSFDPQAATLGANQIIYSVSAGACTDADTVIVTVNPGPNASINPQANVCADASVLSLTAQTPGGTWNGPGIVDAVNGSFDPTVAQSGTHPVVYSVTALGCTALDTLHLTVFPVPNAGIVPVSALCSDAGAQVVQTLTAGGIFSGNGVVNTSLGIFDPQVAGAGTSFVSYSLNVNGCTAADSVAIVVNQTPNATITAPSVLCTNQNLVALQAQSSGGTWTGIGIVNAALGTFNPQQALMGANTIIYNVSQNGCSDADTVVINVNQAPDATISNAPSEICSNSPAVTLNSLFPGGTWSGPGITNAVGGILTPSAMLPGNNIIQYSMSQNGCSDVKSVAITRLQAPNAGILSTPGTLCTNEPAQNLIATSPGGFWTGNGIINASAGTFSPEFAGVGTYSIVYSVIQNNCFDSDTISVSVVAAPVVSLNLSGLQEACEGNGIVLSGSGAASYQWFMNGQVIPGAVNPAFTAVQGGTYTLQGTTGQCSSVSTGVPVLVNPKPQVLQISALPVCEGTVSSFSNQSVVAQNTGSVISGYVWNFGDGNSGTGVNAQHQYMQAGAYNATLLITTNKGCSDSLTQTVLVNPVPQFVQVAAPNVCQPNISQFSASASVAALNGSVVNGYTWNFGNGLQGSGAVASHLYQNPGPYTYTVTAVTNQGCSVVHTGQTQVYQKPAADFISTNVCTDQPNQFIDISDAFGDAIVGWNWNFGDGTGQSNQQNPQYQYNVAGGLYAVSMQIQTASGCTDTRHRFVQVNQSPNAQWNVAILGANNLAFSPVNPNPNATFVWHFPHDNTFYYQTQVTKNFPQSGDYQVCLTVQVNGCSVTECGNVTASVLSQSAANSGSPISVFPNPFVSEFRIQLAGNSASVKKVELYDMSGRCIQTLDKPASDVDGSVRVVLPVSALSTGVYLLKVETSEGLYHQQVIQAP